MRPEDVARAVALYNDGRSVRYIANVMNMTRSTTHDAIKRYRETLEYTRRPGSGRPRATNPNEDRTLDIIFNNCFDERLCYIIDKIDKAEVLDNLKCVTKSVIVVLKVPNRRNRSGTSFQLSDQLIRSLVVITGNWKSPLITGSLVKITVIENELSLLHRAHWSKHLRNHTFAMQHFPLPVAPHASSEADSIVLGEEETIVCREGFASLFGIGVARVRRLTGNHSTGNHSTERQQRTPQQQTEG
ncbi:hypothetical protein ANN_09471 [Periplaneta americana]|uniref:Uncharacterized protein n=1 Tax=Periplaneta americana TaxID=6978 RepID=A0ABQ8TLQ2_PERAM|nr:hypothetical protein ANN_09471 [Periplaneta americana]